MVETRIQSPFLVFLLISCICYSAISAAAANDASGSLEQRCSSVVGKMGMCLDFVTGKKESPSTECCAAATDMRNKDPVCLCYVIQQTHKGDANLKQMGIQEAKILQLPAVCKIKDSSVSDCPKYLHIPPSSPDYAFFTNASSTASSSQTTGTLSSPEKSGSSDGIMHRSGVAAAVAMAVIIIITGYMPMIRIGAW